MTLAVAGYTWWYKHLTSQKSPILHGSSAGLVDHAILYQESGYTYSNIWLLLILQCHCGYLEDYPLPQPAITFCRICPAPPSAHETISHYLS